MGWILRRSRLGELSLSGEPLRHPKSKAMASFPQPLGAVPFPKPFLKRSGNQEITYEESSYRCFVSCRVLYGLFDGVGVNAGFDIGCGGTGAHQYSANCGCGQWAADERRSSRKDNSDAANIKTLAGDFAKVSSESGPGVCQQLQAAIGAYQADQQLVLQVAQVSDANTQTKITLLSGLVAGTVQAITAVIPSCQSASQSQSQRFEAVPPYRISNFADHYNSVLVAKTGNAAMDAVTPAMRLPGHSKVVRVLTFGKLR